jgi:hypothetical protein
VPCFNLAAECAQAIRECIGDRLRAASRKRPPADMRQHEQDERERCGRTLLEGKHGVCADAGEERLCGVGPEPSRRNALYGLEARRCEARNGQWMTRDVQERREQRSFEHGPRSDRPGEKLSVGVSVDTQATCSRLERAVHHNCGSVVQRVRQRGWRLHHGQIELEPTEERRRRDERVDRRADVVPEPRQRQFSGASAAADRRLTFEDANRSSRLRERNRSCEPVRPGADDDGVRR